MPGRALAVNPGRVAHMVTGLIRQATGRYDDAIEEFNIEKTSYAPEFGGKSGAVINIVSKSGSNNLHGSLFEFVRNDVFDAKNFFDSAAAHIPPFRQNQFGGSVGGPLRENRTFLFVSYEGQRVRKSLTQTFSVPTAAMRPPAG